MNADPLLGEIRSALVDLLEKGEPYTIYSNKLPTTLEDRYFLQDVLGKGDWFMYEKVLHTKTVAFNTLIPGVWIEVVFSERNPAEPILEMVQVNWSPPVFTIPKEDAQNGFKKFTEDIEEYKNYVTPFAREVAKAYETFLKTGEGFILENPEGVENLTIYLITESELVLENKRSGEKIVSSNYYGIWIGYNPEGTPIKLFIGDFPKSLKPTKEDLKKAIDLLEERRKQFLPKYTNRVNLPLL
ncbi:MAG: hypothetical protein DSZ31_03805 [Gammaproteobacteria bacterium]|nr:MAG: hypothetical protein DSZ31_03805 [Gammaproteobacteria bacterium]